MRFLGEASTRVKAQAIADALRSTQPCVLHEAWTRARSELVTTLGAMPLSSLALVTPTRA